MHYDLLGVRIQLITDSQRMADEARLFLGDHTVGSARSPTYRFRFKESAQMPDFGLADWGACEGQRHRVVERDQRVFVGVAEGVACLNHATRTCQGHVFPRRNGRWHPEGSVPLLHPLILRIMFAQGFLPLHAGAVVYRKRLIVIAGPKGAGKSSVVARLHRHGCSLVCDDLLYLAPDRSGLLGGGHCQPIKLVEGEAPLLPADCRCRPGEVRVKGKQLYSVRKLAPRSVNRLYPVGAILLLMRSEKGHQSEVSRHRTAEVLYHILGEAPFSGLTDYSRRALEWLGSASSCSWFQVQADQDVDETCRAIMRAIG